LIGHGVELVRIEPSGRCSVCGLASTPGTPVALLKVSRLVPRPWPQPPGEEMTRRVMCQVCARYKLGASIPADPPQPQEPTP
jgi:hypothetical protein